MQDVLNTLLNAHAQAKNVAINGIQNDEDIQQHLDTIKSIYACIQAVKAAYGL